MKTKRHLLFITVPLLAITAFLFWRSCRSPEPIYKGKPFAYWLDLIYLGDSQPLGLSSNALPILLKAMDTRGVRTHKVYQNLWTKLPQWAKRNMPAPYDRSVLRVKAALQLEFMGGDARPAIPVLIHLSATDPDKYIREVAIRCLQRFAHTDENASNAVNNVLNSRDPTIRKMATEAVKSAEDDQ